MLSLTVAMKLLRQLLPLLLVLGYAVLLQPIAVDAQWMIYVS